MTEWKTIESAPKDGTQILLHFDWEPLTVVGYWGAENIVEDPSDDLSATWRVKWDGMRLDGGYDEPTHWMPIPELPPKP